MPKRKDFKPYRVEIHPAFDLWMRGARFGEVQKEYLNSAGELMVAIRMDHPQVRKLFRCALDDVKVL